MLSSPLIDYKSTTTVNRGDPHSRVPPEQVEPILRVVLRGGAQRKHTDAAGAERQVHLHSQPFHISAIG